MSGLVSTQTKRCLVTELWWIGDATLMTSVLQGLLTDGWDVTALAKPQTRALLQASYPAVHWIEFDAPWTPLYGKYRLWRWPWRALIRVLRQVRGGRFDAVISVRRDPREHFLLWLSGIPRRIGFSHPWGRGFLNEPIATEETHEHRVEDWWQLQSQLSPSTRHFPPQLNANAALVEIYRDIFARDPRPVLALHCGARIPLRRWPVSYFREVIVRLRQEFSFQLVLFPDVDGYGSELGDLADHTLTGLTMDKLVAALSCSHHLLCNDSGPAHVADALGVPVTVLFGPGRPEKLRPFSSRNHVVIRNTCPYHPCSDYCRFPEPYCLTQMTAPVVWPEIRDHVAATNGAAFLPSVDTGTKI